MLPLPSGYRGKIEAFGSREAGLKHSGVFLQLVSRDLQDGILDDCMICINVSKINNHEVIFYLIRTYKPTRLMQIPLWQKSLDGQPDQQGQIGSGTRTTELSV